MIERLYARWVCILSFADLTTGGSPSFSKFVCLTILGAAIAQKSLTLGVIIALLAASFGRSVFLAFINMVRPRGGLAFAAESMSADACGVLGISNDE